jgi:hypothetical protein
MCFASADLNVPLIGSQQDPQRWQRGDALMVYDNSATGRQGWVEGTVVAVRARGTSWEYSFKGGNDELLFDPKSPTWIPQGEFIELP